MAVACGGAEEDPMTFGEGAVALAVPFCERSVECGDRPEGSQGVCADSQVYQLCDAGIGQWDCSQELTEREEAMFLQCAEDLAVRECGGEYTDTCLAVLQLETGEQ